MLSLEASANRSASEGGLSPIVWTHLKRAIMRKEVGHGEPTIGVGKNSLVYD